MRRPNSRLALTAVLFVLGFLVVAQLRSQATDSGLATRSAQDLTVLVANLTTRNEQLRDEISSLSLQQQAISSTVARGDNSSAQIRSDLNRVRAWSGELPLTGQGIRVEVTGAMTGEAISSLVNELRNAGAEGIAIGGVRFVPGVVATGPAGGATLQGVALPDPFAITAVGQAESLSGSLTRAGGPIAQLAAAFPDVVISVSSLDRVMLPATTRDLDPVLGKPRL